MNGKIIQPPFGFVTFKGSFVPNCKNIIESFTE